MVRFWWDCPIIAFCILVGVKQSYIKLLKQFVIIDVDKVTKFEAMKAEVKKQFCDSFLQGEINQILWKRFMLKSMDTFIEQCFSTIRPATNIGYQLQILGDGQWKLEDMEIFLHPAIGVVDYRGVPKRNPKMVYEPSTFPSGLTPVLWVWGIIWADMQKASSTTSTACVIFVEAVSIFW